MEIKVTRKTIREFVKNGEATDITSISFDDAKKLTADEDNVYLLFVCVLLFYLLFILNIILFIFEMSMLFKKVFCIYTNTI